MTGSTAAEPLNLFQRTMLRWRSLHPYNPVHVVRVPAPLDLGRLRAVIASQLEFRALTGLRVDPAGRRFRFAGGPAEPQLEPIAGAEVTPAQLAAAIEGELNRPFEQTENADPFRFLVARAGSSFQLALVYDHFVAGGDAIAGLLSAVAMEYLCAEPIRVPAPQPCTAPTYRSVFLRHPIWALRAVLGLPSLARRVRRASRPPGMDTPDASNGLVLARIDAEPFGRLLDSCKTWGVTVNDVLLAALMLALAPLAEARHRHPRRTELAVASIVNIRKDFPAACGDALSPCLAAFQVGHALPEDIGLRELARDVHAITQRIRDRRLYLRSILALGLAALLWPRLGRAQQRGLYAKHFPAWGGVTSLNLNPIWTRMAMPGSERLDYFRVVPTGPLCPLVLAATTAHDVMHLGITFRRAVFAPQTMTQLAADLLRQLELPGAAP